MSLKALLGLEDTDISEDEITFKIGDALRKNLDVVEFVTADGEKITVKLPHTDFAKYIDSWDSTVGKGNYPHL